MPYCTILLCAPTESQVELERSEYRVLENEGPIEVCVVLVGAALNEIGLVALTTEDGSATGAFEKIFSSLSA